MGDFNTLSRFDYKQHEQSNLLTMLKRKDHAVSDDDDSNDDDGDDDDDYIDDYGDDDDVVDDDNNLIHIDLSCIFYFIRFLKDSLRNGLIMMKITLITLQWMFCYPLAYMMDA
jgi:hypothetical protein